MNITINDIEFTIHNQNGIEFIIVNDGEIDKIGLHKDQIYHYNQMKQFKMLAGPNKDTVTRVSYPDMKILT
jgi:hypothetical protein